MLQLAIGAPASGVNTFERPKRRLLPPANTTPKIRSAGRFTRPDSGSEGRESASSIFQERPLRVAGAHGRAGPDTRSEGDGGTGAYQGN